MLESAKYQDVKLPREQSCSEFVQNSSKALRKHATKTETETEQNRDRERGLEPSRIHAFLLKSCFQWVITFDS